MMNPHRRLRRHGFILIEAMLAVAIFALGVLALGKSVNACLSAVQFTGEDARAGRALENRLAEIEAGAVPMEKPFVEDLKEPFTGLRLTQTPTILKIRNERGEELNGLYSVNVEITWESRGDKHSKSLIVYVQARQ